MKTNQSLRKIKQKRSKINQKTIETIEICPETGQIIGWCKTLKDLGLFSCDKDCDTCFCG